MRNIITKIKEYLGSQKQKWKQNLKSFLKAIFLVIGFIVLSIILMLGFALVLIKITDSAEFGFIGVTLGMLTTIVILSYVYPVLCKYFDKYLKEKPGGV